MREKKKYFELKNDEFFHDQIWTEFKSRVLWKINCDKSFFNHSGPLLPPLLWDCSGWRSLRRVRNYRSRRRRRRRREQACWGWDSRQTSAKKNNTLIGLNHFICGSSDPGYGPIALLLEPTKAEWLLVRIRGYQFFGLAEHNDKGDIKSAKALWNNSNHH